MSGSGMVSFYLSDLQRPGLNGVLPMSDKTTYGLEDIALEEALDAAGLYRRRLCTPSLWHLYHGKRKWDESIDGTHRMSAVQAQLLEKARALNPKAAKRCVRHCSATSVTVPP